jgi:putative transposase
MTYSETSTNITSDDNICSIDLGCSNIATCFVSNNNSFSIKNKTFKSLEKRCDNVQSKKDLCKRGSKRFKKISKVYRKLKRKLSNKNKDFQHKVSKVVIDNCVENKISNLIIGDISTKQLTKSKIANVGLNKSTQNRGTLSRFKTFLEYKAKNVGIVVKLQEESYTSKTNCLTGNKFKKMDISVREVELKENLVIDRDLNGAINIAKKAKDEWLTQIENYLLNNSFHKIYIDEHSNQCMNKLYTNCNLFKFV